MTPPRYILHHSSRIHALRLSCDVCSNWGIIITNDAPYKKSGSCLMSDDWVEKVGFVFSGEKEPPDVLETYVIIFPKMRKKIYFQQGYLVFTKCSLD